MTIGGEQAVARPSLYALICLARHVQRAGQLLKAKVQAHKSPLLIDYHERFVHLASNKGQSFINSWKRRPDRPPSPPSLRRGAREKIEIRFTTLLHDLDHHIGTPHYRPLEETAADENLFVGHNVRYGPATSLAKACHVFDLSTSLLARLESRQAGDQEGDVNDYPRCHAQVCSIQDEKTIANLEHLLHCLQQDAWNALIQHFLRIIDTVRDHWNRYWQRIEQLDGGWFAEWPNGHRPLSTTWPWNIKPSLVVLWGVCWMFVYTEPRRSRGGGQSQWSNIAHAQAQAQAQAQAPGHAPYGQNLTPGYYVTNNNGVPVPALSRLSSGGTAATARLSESSPPHAHARLQTHLQLATPYQAENVASPFPYRLDDPLAAATSYNSNSADLPFVYDSPLTDFSWTIPSSNAPDQVWSSDTGDWQHGLEQSPPSLVNPLGKHPQPSRVPHAPAYLTLSTSYTPEVTLAPHPGESSNLESELIAPMHSTPRIPSPYSENSDSRQCPLGGLSPNSDQTRGASSISVSSPRPGISPTQARTEEPPRNAEGNMFCSHVDCSNQNKTFQRKCEWSKHMDKHERPHKCAVAGCEKLPGFTYAGGLLRHEREVHHMHGGPKASRMCPHIDCKRSTGVGFTRKENLQEHLRRVHRGVEDNPPKLEPEQGPFGVVGGLRKRKRVPSEEDHNNISDEDTDDMQESVKRLKQEMMLLQERVHRLETWVTTLIPGTNRLTS